MSAPMAAGRELDAMVAEQVMGLHLCDHGQSYLDAPAPRQLRCDMAHYSTDIADAWRVVERMRESAPDRYRNLSLVAYCYNRTYATFDVEALADYSADTWSEANGEHATPLAICMAALSARRASPGPETPHE